MPKRKTSQSPSVPFTSPKQVFTQSLEWSIPITWFDRQGLHRLDDDRVAAITLEIQGVSGSYPGFHVEIVSQVHGKLFQKFFNFNDYLPPHQRSDHRTDYTGGFVVNANCGWQWYIAIPASTQPFTEAIERWIEHFR